MKTKVINRGNLAYVLYPDRVVVKVSNGHYVSYDKYNNPKRENIKKFRDIILGSNDSEYASPLEQMSLAVQCKLKGTSTYKPKELE